jgi:formamidopyrimidine-DNA glycosylase
MPELPEVETVCNAIRKSIKTNKIKEFVIINPKLRWNIDTNIKKLLSKVNIKKIYRRGKYIIFDFNHGSLIIHLGMTGVIKFLKNRHKVNKHDHYEIKFQDNTILRYNDVRKFGSIHWAENIEDNFLIKKLGVEPLSDNFNYEYIKKISKKRNVVIKNIIMDQRIVVGIGNIYASEALYMSKIKPNKNCKLLSTDKFKNLVKSIKKVLQKSIKAGGTSIKDFQSIDGSPGYFKQKLLIYGLEKCACGKKIKNIRISGRSSFYCSNCQK